MQCLQLYNSVVKVKGVRSGWIKLKRAVVLSEQQSLPVIQSTNLLGLTFQKYIYERQTSYKGDPDALVITPSVGTPKNTAKAKANTEMMIPTINTL